MKHLFAMAVLLLPIAGYTCTTAIFIDPQCEAHPDACASRDLLRDFHRADVVYEVIVQSVRTNWLDWGRTSANDVVIEHIWKTDGKPIDVLEAGWGGGDCTVGFEAGSRYIVFGHRKKSIWSDLPWVTDSLYAWGGGTFLADEFKNISSAHAALYGAKSPQDLEAVLTRLESVSLPPNKSLERSRDP